MKTRMELNTTNQKGTRFMWLFSPFTCFFISIESFDPFPSFPPPCIQNTHCLPLNRSLSFRNEISTVQMTFSFHETIITHTHTHKYKHRYIATFTQTTILTSFLLQFILIANTRINLSFNHSFFKTIILKPTIVHSTPFLSDNHHTSLLPWKTIGFLFSSSTITRTLIW